MKNRTSQVRRIAGSPIQLAIITLIAGISSAQAQEAASPADTQQVIVTGLRASMQSTMNLKRNADGIVDGVVAADIGKFPDTNLAESIQRISGVSIDRTNGEGSKVTVRGVGPDFNLVLLNGRQMPVSNVTDLSGRSFDFANIASEAVSQIQVYKTMRAETPTGGIGATVNIMTARPLDNPGQHASIGAKAVFDTSNNNLPDQIKASKSMTPEISGIYSNTTADGMFGVALSGSYQSRNLGFNQASVPNGWRGPFRGDDANSWGRIADGSNTTNHPTASDIYAVPQNAAYTLTGVQRQRTNGQLTLQFKPNKDLTTTLDYTLSQNKIQTKAAELGAWFNFGPSVSSWTKGPIASPLFYTETLPRGSDDVSMNGYDYATKTQNKSLGFNAEWKATSALKLVLDAHHSTSESGADSPFGSANKLGVSSFSRGDTSFDFTHDFPVLSIKGADYLKAPFQVGGSWFQNSHQKMAIDQIQAKGTLKISEESRLNFGVTTTDVDNRSSFSNVQRDTWGGATSAADYPASLFKTGTLSQYFKKISGYNSPGLFNQLTTWDFATIRQHASDVSGLPAMYLPNFATNDTDRSTDEKSKSAFVQYSTDWNTAMPIHTAFGARFEKTDVVSKALVPTATGISWVSQNEFPVQFGPAAFTTLTGKYQNVLPSADFDIDLRSDMKARASYGETIGRPRYDQIQGGQVLNTASTVGGGTGSVGNPGLKPVKSKNLDLSLEWYYDKQSLVSLGLFNKKLSNYAGTQVTTSTPFNLHTPVGGALWNEAISVGGCIASDTTCLRNYIFRKHPTAPGVTPGPDNTLGNATGTIAGQPGDPIANFQLTSYANARAAEINGVELNVQHMFGNSGFGVSANMTKVNSGLKYVNTNVSDQFALIGLSDSANLVGIYEQGKWSVRAAYNWRDEFLSSTTDGAGPNPQYVEAYGQLDFSASYAWDNHLSFQLEAINLTDSIQRIHGRTKMMVESVTQAGPRYMISANYKF